MPYKDPNKKRASAREGMRRVRERRRLEKLGCDSNPGPKVAPGPTMTVPSLTRETLTRERLSEVLLELGLLFLEKARTQVEVCPRDAISLTTFGADLVKANMPLSDTNQIQRGSVLDDHPFFLRDDLYMDLAERMLERRSQLQAKLEEEQAVGCSSEPWP